MFQVKNKSTRGHSGAFIVNFEYVWHVVQLFFADFEHINAGWNTLLSLNLNLRVHSRV